MNVVRIAPGVYRVEQDGRNELVYVAGTPPRRWAFWNGRIFRERPTEMSTPTVASGAKRESHQELSAPMPATVLKVLVNPGAAVKKGQMLVILEAMKMELPLRAPSDATVTAVKCREGELVQPDTVLVEFS